LDFGAAFGGVVGLEGGGEDFGIWGEGLEEGFEGGDACDGGLGPGEFFGGEGDGGGVAGEAEFGLLFLGGFFAVVGVLEFGAEVADVALGFFGGALVVEIDQALEEDLVVFLGVFLVDFLHVGGDAIAAGAGVDEGVEAGFGVVALHGFGVLVPLPDIRPAVGLVDGLIEVVVDLFEEGDEGAVVDVFVLVAEGFFFADFFEDVVDASEGEVGVLGLAPGFEIIRLA